MQAIARIAILLCNIAWTEPRDGVFGVFEKFRLVLTINYTFRMVEKL